MITSPAIGRSTPEVPALPPVTAPGSPEWALKEGLSEAAVRARAQGLPVPALEGKLLRPLVAYLSVPSSQRESLDGRFWSGALAIQMVHEASLLHDDILDDASVRRGRETLVASKGVGRALVEGDHLLTASYRVALATGSLSFADAFATGVERTVAGEKLQAMRAGKLLSEAEYQEVVDGKSGELFGAAVSLWPSIAGAAQPEAVRHLGVRLGRFYQRIDDFLDYCVSAEIGKSPLQDFRQRKWTWVLGFTSEVEFGMDEDILPGILFATRPGVPSPMGRALRFLETEAADLVRDFQAALGTGPDLPALLEGWLETVRSALHREESVVGAGALDEEWLPAFGRHSRTFRFASRLFPPEEEKLVAGIYAFCRFTDDLVDGREDLPAVQLDGRVEAWRHLVDRAYHHRDSGVELLDTVMAHTAARGVPLRYALDLVDGVGMDIRPREYETLDDLLGYTYRVAGAVGLWMTELFGISDRWVLERAEALGHAMQLTNILRDVGEDWRMGRVYLPADLRARHGVDTALLDEMVSGRIPPTAGYIALIEELMAEADRRYDFAMEAVPDLPAFFRRPVAVAGRVYQGIHARIRANGHDNLTLRAYTRPHHKLGLAAAALWRTRSRPEPRSGQDSHRMGGIGSYASFQGPDQARSTT